MPSYIIICIIFLFKLYILFNFCVIRWKVLIDYSSLINTNFGKPICKYVVRLTYSYLRDSTTNVNSIFL